MAAENIPIHTVGSLPRIVPVVLPASEDLTLSGKVRNVPVFGHVDASGWLVWDDEAKEWLVSPVKKGHRHLRDYYDDEHNPEGWATYKRYVRDWQKGLTQEPFPLDLLPKRVQEMQQGLVGAEKPDPWRRQRPKPTTGALANVPSNPAPEQPSRRSRGPRIDGNQPAPPTVTTDEPEAT